MVKKRISIKSAKAKARLLQNWAAEQVSIITGIPWGKDEQIAPREMGQSGVDIRLIATAKKLFPWSVECKWQETWSIPSWIKQAKKNQIEDTDWLLVCRKSHDKPVVIMDAGVFFKIYQRIIGDDPNDPATWEDTRGEK